MILNIVLSSLQSLSCSRRRIKVATFQWGRTQTGNELLSKIYFRVEE